jgi:hypothetical protein
MIRMSRRVGSFVGVIILIATSSMISSSATECVGITADVPKLLRESDLVFTGILIKNEHQERLTFRADRIWKGRPASRDIVVYQLGVGFIGQYIFQQGEKYLMFANVLPANDRRLAGVSPDELIAFGIPSSCGSPRWPLKLTAELDKIARSQKPRG